MIFGKPSQNLERLFDGANFIQWVNWYKMQIDHRNPHSKEKPYSNLAWILQTYEVRVMGEVWANLAKDSIPFLTVHDEIIGMQSDTKKIDAVMQSVLSKHFKAYKLNVEKVQEPEQVAVKLSLSDIALQTIGERNHLSERALIDKMIQMYQIDKIKAEIGLKSLIDNKLIEPTHIGTYVLSWSTPF